MRKKLMLLVFILPIVLVIVAFAITSSALIQADIPVTGIEIISGKDNGFIYLDYVNPYENNMLQVEVYPKNAKNKDYQISVAPDKGSDTNAVSIDKDGYIKVEKVGKSIVTVKSNDGGFTSQRLIIVSSSKVTDMVPIMVSGNEKVAIDDEITLDEKECYIYPKAIPKNITIKDVTYEVLDNNILEISEYGKLIGKRVGNTNVTMSYMDGADGVIKKTFKVNVTTPTNVENKLSISTFYDREPNTLMYFKGGLEEQIFVDYDFSDEATYNWSSNNNNVKIEGSGKRASIVVPEGVKGTINLTIQDSGKTYNLVRDIEGVQYIKELRFNKQYEKFGLLDLFTVGEYELNDGNYVKGLNLHIQGVKDMLFEDVSRGNIEFVGDESIISYDQLGALDIKKDGIVNISARYKYDAYFAEKTQAQIKVKFINEGVNVYNFDQLHKATLDSKRVVVMNDIDLFKEKMSLEELKNAVSYMKTTQNWQYYQNVGEENNRYEGNRPSVMYALEFKNDVFGNGYTISANNITTATYESKIGDNRIYIPFYNGPLNFVAMESIDEEDRKLSAASVKGQDNISFLVRENNVLIDNISLKACDDEYLVEDGNLNLNKLNKVGTTLEILGDNVEIRNSRITNGRTVMRVYGGKDTLGYTEGNPIIQNFNVKNLNMDEERIVVNINNSVIKNGREFLVKIGSNRGIKSQKSGKTQKIYPLMAENDLPYKPDNLYDPENRKEFQNSVEVDYNDPYFYNKYVTTDVTIEDSVLENSGLFTIGVETAFSGQFLEGINDPVVGGILGGLLPTWHDLVATSFASVLRLKGDVELLDWKKLANLNGDTLIESDANGLSDFLKLDFVKMINSVKEVDPSYNPLIDDVNGEQYVHGGVAFYGGGYNYSQIDLSNLNNQDFLGKYKINLNILTKSGDTTGVMQGTALPLAAGKEDFTFYMYQAGTKSSYQNILERINSGKAYECLRGKE